MSNLGVAPKLSGDALGAVNHRGSHLQIIAAAGSGKTEVVSQRIVSLVADGFASREIVGFTFTEKAAEELKQLVSLRLAERLGVDELQGPTPHEELPARCTRVARRSEAT